MSIYVNVIKQKMYISSHFDDIVAGSQRFVKFRFNLSEEWDGLSVFAQFRQNGKAYNDYLDNENAVYLPAEIGAGTCTLMLYGTKDTTVGTTNYLTFRVGPNHLISDAESTDISQSLYAQLVSRVEMLEANGPAFTDNIYAAVKEEMSNYLNSGVLSQLAIEDGSVTRAKLSDDVNTSLNQIDAATEEMMELGESAVRYTAQELGYVHQAQARQNIDAVGREEFDFQVEHLQEYADELAEGNLVFHSKDQELTENHKEQARKNIGAASSTNLSRVQQIAEDAYEATFSVVSFNAQTLTPEQKEQARKNIGALGEHSTELVIAGEDQSSETVIYSGGSIDYRNAILCFDGAQCADAPVLRGIADGINDNDVATVGQAKAFYVTVTSNAPGEYSIDKSYAEAKAAHDSGRTLWCKYNDYIAPAIEVNDDVVIFSGFLVDTNMVLVMRPDGDFQVITNTFASALRVEELGEAAERTSRRVTAIDENSDDEHYPTAKAVYDAISEIEPGTGGGGDSGDIDVTKLEKIENRVNFINAGSDNEHYPTAKAVYDAISGINPGTGQPGNPDNAVLYTGQKLTAEEQDQALQNLGIENTFERSVNLYNESTNTVGMVISAAGAETANNGYTTTHYIYLPAGDYVMTFENLKKFTFMATYSTDKVFKSRTEVKAGNFTITEACYVRFSGVPGKVAGIMLVSGTELPSEYIPYGYSFAVDGLNDGAITKEKLDFIKKSSNLINHMTITEDQVVSATGVITTNAQYCITDKMYLKRSTVYTCKNVFRVSYFKADGTHIVSIGYNDNLTTFTTRNDFDYVIISLNDTLTVKREWQLNEGNELLPYEKQYLIVDGFRVYDDFDVDIDPIKEFGLKDRIVFDKSPVFTLDTEVAGVGDADRGVDAILGHYDALMSQHPLYITKIEIGEDSSGNKLYRYDFKNPGAHHEHGQYSEAKPKVILISGIHAEYAGIYSLYNAMEQIATNPNLQHLRNEVHFIVVPAVNLYGITNSSRTNINGVDLARNFEVDWGTNPGDTVPDSSTYCGVSALSEPECQAIDRLMAENSDAILFTSCHSFQGVTGQKDFIWGALATKYGTNLGDKLVMKLSQEWMKKYDIIDEVNGYINNYAGNNYIGFVDVSAPAGSEGRHAMKYGIHGGTLEVCDYFHFPEEKSQRLTGFVISRGAEAYINWVLLNVYNYDPNF